MLVADVETTPDGHVVLVANGEVPGITSSDDYKGDLHYLLLNARLRTVVHHRWATLEPYGLVQARSVAVGPTGATYISGAAAPGLDFAPGRRVRTVLGRMYDNPFLLRVAPTGRFDWVVGYDFAPGAPPTIVITGVDADDRVEVGGTYPPSTDFNPSPRKRFTLQPPDSFFGSYTAVFSSRGALISAEDDGQTA